MKQVYFLCTGNSCRSQMAEGFARRLLDSKWEVQSAGVETHGLNPMAVQVMGEVGIDISQQYSKLIDRDYLNTCDVVVTLCGDARNRCPVTPASVQRVHWPLPDPAQATGTDDDKLRAFREVRDEIRQRIETSELFK
ncbi:MAG TPA: arsenate reductase (thioredoxin) [Lactobacillus sp.]|nr:arsenate reductase (thioredoxin) [Lactobacillus sp.]